MSRSKNPGAYAAIAMETFLFAGLSPEDVEKCLTRPGVTVEHFEAGSAIRTRRDAASSLGVLLYGAAAVEKRGEKGRILMSILGPGDLFGAAAMFGKNDTYVADITATKSSWALMLPEAALKDMMRSDFRIAENYLRYLTARIRFLSDRIDGFAEGNVETRVLHFMEKNAENGVFKPDYPLSALADALAVSRATLYRALDALAAAGRIKKDQRMITILEVSENDE